MKETIQIIGGCIAGIILILGYARTVLSYKSSARSEVDVNWMFEGFFASSAIAIVVILIFLGISLLF